MTPAADSAASASNPIDESALRAAAASAAGNAYSPYSKFRVGAALLCADGTIYPGCNIENASYGLTICAERTALFASIAAGHRAFTALALCCPDAPADMPLSYRMPCGACRQTLAEFFAPTTPIFIAPTLRFTLADLLPNPFTLRPD